MVGTPLLAKRDARIDLARGLCLWFILVDHMQGNVLGLVTLRSFAVCDAADVFVFLCGVSASLAYGRTFDREGWWAAGRRALSRVRTLYLAHLALLAALAAFTASSGALGHADAGRFLALQDQPLDAGRLLRLALMLEQPGDLDLLPLYMLLLAWFALVLPLTRRPLCLLALSGGL